MLPSSLHILVGGVTDVAGKSKNEASSSICEKKHTPLETNTSLHSHSLHITNAPDAAGPQSRHGSHWRALAIVVAREADELLHCLPCHVILALGDANDAHGLIFHASVWLSLHQLVAVTWRKKVRNLNQSKKSRKQVCIEMQVHDSRNYSSWTI